MLYISTYKSPIGKLTIASNGTSITGLWTKGQKYYSNGLFKDAIEKDLPVFDLAQKWLDRYFNKEKPDIKELPIMLLGSDFRKEVLSVLCSVPYGKTTTYKDIAKQVAIKTGKEKMSAQAVGGAVGHNPISIIVPCHRVVGCSGSLTGYAGGIDTKIILLSKYEDVDVSKMFMPK